MKILPRRLPPLRWAGLTLLAAALASPARADYQSTVLSQGPVGFWRLNETTQPPQLPIAAANAGSLGTGGNGTLSDGVVRGQPGEVGKSYGFSNPGWVVTYFGSHVDVANTPALNPNGPFTVEFWAKPSSMPPDLFSPVCSLDTTATASSREGYLFYADGTTTPGRWQFRIGGSGGYTGTAAGGSLETNAWQHVVGVYSGTNVVLYVNGVAVANAPTTGFTPNSTQPFRIGATTIPNRTFDGSVDEVAFYGSILDATTVKAHYDAATTNNAGYASQILANNPLGYWRLEEPGDPVAANLGTLGAAANGNYVYKAIPGVTGPTPPPFPGFDSGNKAVAFDGTGGYVTTPPLNINTNTVTITGWINATGSQAAATGLIMSRGGSTVAGLAIDVAGGLALTYNWAGDTATYNWASGLSLPDSTWAFVALVVQPDQAAIYVANSTNATSFIGATNNTTHAVQPFDGLTYFGADLSPNSGSAATYLNGAIDEVAIFNRSLGEGEIYSQYAAAVGGLAPIVFADPQAPASGVFEGDTLTLSVDAGGTPGLSYQWRKGGQPIQGATTSSYVKANITLQDTGNYDVVVTNAFGNATSQAAAINVTALSAPSISQGLVGRTLFAGGTLNLNVVASGGALTYLWSKDGSVIPGATGSAYVVPSVTTNDAGSYQVTVTNRIGTGSSGPVSVAVVSPATGSYEAAVVADSPEAWWRLNEMAGATTMADVMGRHDGTYVNNVTLGAPGVVANGTGDTAASFDGASYGSVPFSAALNTKVFTIECWVKADSLTDNRAPASSHYSNRGWYFQTAVPTAGQWAGGVGVGGSEYYVPSTAAAVSMQTNVWTQLVMTVDSTGTLLFYINGQWDGQAWADFDRNTSGPFIIGGRGGSSGTPADLLWKGEVDEVTFYTTSLSLAQVQAHYAAALYGSNTKPVFKVQPQSQSATVGSQVSFQPRVEGSLPITFQWWKDNAPLANQTKSTLTLTNLTAANSGNYQLMATNGAGYTASAVATLSVLPTPSSVNLTNGLVLHLKLDGTYADSSGSGNNGNAGGAPTFIPGKIGSGAVELNTVGSSSTYNYISIPYTNSLAFGATDSFSVSLWVNYTNTPDDLPMIGNSINSTYQKGWVFADDKGQFEWTLGADDSTSVIADPVGGPAINNGVWHNLVVSFDRAVGIANTYIDGVQIDSRSIQGLGSLDNGNPIALAQDPTGTYGVDGTFLIDDVGIWRRPLSTYEAQAIYHVGQSGSSFDTPQPTTPPTASIAVQGGALVITYTGTLSSSVNPAGPYTDVKNATSPYTVPASTGPIQFYRSHY